jgi:flagellar assembly factor FliW
VGIVIKTKACGEIEVDEKQVLDFPEGILGFDYVKKFILMDSDKEESPFKWLQAYDEPELAFVVIRPIDFMIEYELMISHSDIEAVKAADASELLVFAIVTIPSNPSEMTANLLGPIIINPNARIGKQAITLSDKYSVKHKILDELKKASEDRG